MRLVNLTPHSITVLGADAPLVLAPSGAVARVATETRELRKLDGVSILVQTYGEITGLPAYSPSDGCWEDFTVYVVSALVRLADAADRATRGDAPREDVLSPGELVRDAAGQPTGCRGLVRS